MLVLPFSDYQILKITWPTDPSDGIKYDMDIIACIEPPAGVHTLLEFTKFIYDSKGEGSDLFLLLCRTPNTGAIYVHNDGGEFTMCDPTPVPTFLGECIARKFPTFSIDAEDLKIRPGSSVISVTSNK